YPAVPLARAPLSPGRAEAIRNTLLPSNGITEPARVRTARQCPMLVIEPDRAQSAGLRRPWRPRLDAMPRPHSFPAPRLGNTCLDPQQAGRIAVRVGRARKAEACDPWCLDRLHNVHPMVDHVEQELHHGLRLNVATRRPVRDNDPPVTGDEPRTWRQT